MTRLIALALALGLVAACAEEPLPGQTGGTTNTTGTASARPGSTPTPRPSSPVTASNLSGVWVFGERNEPPAGPVVDCAAAQPLTINDQNGTLSGGVAVCGGPCRLVEPVTGERKGMAITLVGQFKGNQDSAPTRITYVLTYNPETQHLVGTREGVPFWAAPFVASTDKACQGRVY